MKLNIKGREVGKSMKQAKEILNKNNIDNYCVVFPISWYRAYKKKDSGFWAKYKKEHPNTDYYFITSLRETRLVYKLNEEGELERQ